jgi:CRP-like cAMP-binding protein
MPLPPCFLFQGLSELQLDRLGQVATIIQIRTGDWLAREGREADDFFVLQEGSVESLTTVADQFVLPIAIHRSAGDCFGSPALLPPHMYSLSYRCLEDGSVYALSRRILWEFFSEDHEMGFKVMTNLAQHLLSRLRETRQEIKTHFQSLFRSTL